MSKENVRFTLAYYSSDRKTGNLHLIRYTGKQFEVNPITNGPASNQTANSKPILLGVTDEGRSVLLDPKSKQLTHSQEFPVDAFAAHCYSDPKSPRDWFMNDGDKETGNDTLNCGDKGSSVTVVENANTSSAKFVQTICVGRGHHQAAFTFPSDQAPSIPYRAFISNLKDGSLSVIGNDPADKDTYLKNIQTINLAEPDKEDNGNSGIPNNSFPHGLAYSPISGKLYNLNNGYGTIWVIDPASLQVEKRFGFKGHSNLFVTRDGKFIIGRGADRKTDPQHVIAKLSVIDVTDHQIKDSANLSDIYISKYFLNPEGTKLYLTTSSSGSPEQAANCKTDALLVFDLTALPKIKLVKELRLGSASGTLEFVTHGGTTKWVVSSHAEQAELIVIDGQTDEIIEKVNVGKPLTHSRIWLVPNK